MHIKNLGITLAAAALLVFAAACHKASSDDEAIRASVLQHLQKNGGLNLAAMETQFQQITVDGDHAQAQVLFRTKQEGATMQMTYALERRDGEWAVLKSHPTGGQVNHPPVDSSHGGGDPASPGDPAGPNMPHLRPPSDTAPKPGKPR
ncbi:MAG TPA: hypothetical protein VMI93_15020 [Candidatus Solibacter sp.]|nr:hypothetical protein [Candidatus Solibacter sp.]